MDPMSASSQNNQNLNTEDNLNGGPVSDLPKPDNILENSGEDVNIKVPPKGMLDSSGLPMNSNGMLRPDKNIKVNLDLNSAPVLGENRMENNNFQSTPSRPSSSPVQNFQNNNLPPQPQKTDIKNGDQYKLSNGEVQGPKPPLVPNKNFKLIYILVAGVAIGALAIGGYYLMQKNEDDVPVENSKSSETPLPTIDAALDSDSDTIPDAVEIAIGTDPDKMDTDGDTYFDLDEIKSGYSPIIAGVAGKYTPEEWQTLKNKIKAADGDFYANEIELTEKMAGWKKYLSDDFGFEIYYPGDWVFNYPADRMNYMEFKSSGAGQEKISLTFYENGDAFIAANGISLEEYYKKSPIVEKKEILFSGANKFQKLIVHDCPKAGSACTRYFLTDKGRIYQFEQEIENLILDKIFSSFKIIE